MTGSTQAYNWLMESDRMEKKEHEIVSSEIEILNIARNDFVVN